MATKRRAGAVDPPCSAATSCAKKCRGDAGQLHLYGPLILRWVLHFVKDARVVLAIAVSSKDMLRHVNEDMATQDVVRLAVAKRKNVNVALHVKALETVKQLYPPPPCGMHVHYLRSVQAKRCGLCGKADVRVPYGGAALGLPALLHAGCANYCNRAMWTPVTALTVGEVDLLVRRGVACAQPVMYPDYGGFLTMPVGAVRPEHTVQGLDREGTAEETDPWTARRSAAYAKSHRWAAAASQDLARTRAKHAENCALLDRHVARKKLGATDVEGVLAMSDAYLWDAGPDLPAFYRARALDRGYWAGERYTQVYRGLVDTMYWLHNAKRWTAQVNTALEERSLPRFQDLCASPQCRLAVTGAVRSLVANPHRARSPFASNGKLVNEVHEALMSMPAMAVVDALHQWVAPQHFDAAYPGRREVEAAQRELAFMAEEDRLSAAVEVARKTGPGTAADSLRRHLARRPDLQNKPPEVVEAAMKAMHMCIGCGGPSAVACAHSRCRLCCLVHVKALVGAVCKRHKWPSQPTATPSREAAAPTP